MARYTPWRRTCNPASPTHPPHNTALSPQDRPHGVYGKTGPVPKSQGPDTERPRRHGGIKPGSAPPPRERCGRALDECAQPIALTLGVTIDQLAFEEGERGPDDDLRLQFDGSLNSPGLPGRQRAEGRAVVARALGHVEQQLVAGYGQDERHALVEGRKDDPLALS